MKWSDIIQKESLDVGYRLANYAQQEREEGKLICPPQHQIFRALELTPPETVKVCIVGQDPYHTPGQANGLAFSVNNGTQPSLTNIFNELISDIGCGRPTTSDLTPWAKRGVLLLNTALTVYEHQPNSHDNWGWQTFTSAAMDAAVRLPQPIVFVLWGRNAQRLKNSLIIKAAIYSKNNQVIRQRSIKKVIIQSSHPSPFSVSKPSGGTPAFKGSKPFSLTNMLLEEMGGEPIDWSL